VSRRIAEAYIEACLAELQALKPGNVHIFAAGHRMSIADFEKSARVSAPAIADGSLRVGARIHEAVRATHDVVGCNTNLGIVLLCAPLAAASTGSGLKTRLAGVLATLDVDDAEQTFAAIRLASPAGLGDSAEHDVREPARVTLLDAMAAAAERDRIARQYACGFADIFDVGVPRLRAMLTRCGDERWAATSAYLGFLAGFPDSHIVRKYGKARAETVRNEAAQLDAKLLSHVSPEAMTPALLDFDTKLKSEGLNPGTSADLTVASLFALKLENAVASSQDNAQR
jgi:triphosphoribosyl-dephospho-CoA synthase